MVAQCQPPKLTHRVKDTFVCSLSVLSYPIPDTYNTSVDILIFFNGFFSLSKGLLENRVDDDYDDD